MGIPEQMESVGRTMTAYVTMPLLIVFGFVLGGVPGGLVMLVLALIVMSRHEKWKQQQRAQQENG